MGGQGVEPPPKRLFVGKIKYISDEAKAKRHMGNLYFRNSFKNMG